MDDDFDRDSASSEEPEANDQDELMCDGEDQDGDDNDNDQDHDDDENDDDDDDEEDDSALPDQSDLHPTVQRTSATPVPYSSTTPRWQPTMRPEALVATSYDIVPTMAAPQATSINALSVTPDLRYWMTGGSDGYIRKYDGPATINGKQQLTVAQRHPFVDTVQKGGVLLSYWENAEPPAPTSRAEDTVLSPVFSLAVHSRALWLLSGLEGGGINLQSVRHDEGKRIACLQRHSGVVSVLTLAADEKSVLSGGWDTKIFDWDLDTGLVKRQFDGTGGQISFIETRPMGGVPVPPEASEVAILDTFSSDNATPTKGDTDSSGDVKRTGINGSMEAHVNGSNANDAGEGFGPSTLDGQESPTNDSLFGGSPTAGSDLFGDNFGADDDNEFSIAMAQDSAQEAQDAQRAHERQNSVIAGVDISGPSLGPGDESTPTPMTATLNGTSDHAPDGPPNSTSDEPTDTAMAGVPDDTTMLDGASEPPSATEPLVQDAVVSPPASIAQPATEPMVQDAVVSPPASVAQPATEPMVQDAVVSPPASIAQPATEPMDQDAVASSPASIAQPAQDPPMLFAASAPTHMDPSQTCDSTFLAGSIDGTMRIWDRRVANPVARIDNRPGTPPWAMGACWSADGNWIYVGRRNGTVEEFSIAKARGGRAGWLPERVFKLPNGSGPVSCVRPMPNGRHLICASHDILRLYDVRNDPSLKHAPPPFLIVPGPPKAGVISSLYVDATGRYMLSAAGTRGWEGTCTEVLIGYEIGLPSERRTTS